ncbi:hypothetical protein [Fodinicola acaciae]|nr:hypothetical protein [Fodinicola acaciae]
MRKPCSEPVAGQYFNDYYQSAYNGNAQDNSWLDPTHPNVEQPHN